MFGRAVVTSHLRRRTGGGSLRLGIGLPQPPSSPRRSAESGGGECVRSAFDSGIQPTKVQVPRIRGRKRAVSSIDRMRTGMRKR